MSPTTLKGPPLFQNDLGVDDALVSEPTSFRHAQDKLRLLALSVKEKAKDIDVCLPCELRQNCSASVAEHGKRQTKNTVEKAILQLQCWPR
eukprot:CAMPEP_0115533912 /NCGR_PEP_ID=MMETSP0271-20121206/86383_1 /TAXON_ID=71861 /ORGANISM="Scrippsiella trochoidea, Strain CCMP3099" /LENGTH=90 /DNA_ID=CAMNT_0002966343 /DNA_START=116 /DNA_END=388 /DNA_ORIENTATION=+